MIAGLLRLLMPLRRHMVVAVALCFGALAAGLALTATSSYLIAKAAVVDDIAALSIAFAAVRGFAVARAGLRYFERLVSHTLTLRILERLRTSFYAAIEPLAPAALSRQRSGDLLTRAVADVQTLEGFYVRVIMPVAGAALAAVCVVLLLGLFSWAIAAVVLGGLLVAGVGLPLASRRLAGGAAHDLVAARAELQAAVVDRVRGMADLLVFDPSGAYGPKVSQHGARVERAQTRLARTRALNSGALALLAALTGLAVMVLAISDVRASQYDGVYLAMLALVAVASFEVVGGMPAALLQLDESRAAGQRIFDSIDAPQPVAVAANAASRPQSFDLQFREVSFRYGPGGRTALRDVSFDLPAGQALAIAGESGSGKTTLVNLLLRFWDCDAGQVRLDGRDLRDYDVEELRACMGVVPQQVHLFNGTILDNLLVANAAANEAEVRAACQAAMLGGFIEALPEGYETLVGENGLRLSGGERQRLAIARMLLKDAPLLILDEPTANLDPGTEAALVESLRPVFQARSVLLISHSPAVCSLADRVITMSAGRVLGPSVVRP